MWTIISSSYSPIDFQLPQLKTQLQPNKKYRIANPFLFLLIGGVSVIGRRDYMISVIMSIFNEIYGYTKCMYTSISDTHLMYTHAYAYTIPGILYVST